MIFVTKLTEQMEGLPKRFIFGAIKPFFMSQAKLVIIEGPNYERHSLGLIDLEVFPRTGEFIWYEREGDDGPKPYGVKDFNYFLKPKGPVEIWLVSPDDEKYH